MPAGSYLMTSSFSYRKLKKLPDSSHQEPHDQQLQQQRPPAASIQDYYQKYYRALGAAVARTRTAPWRRRRQGATTRTWRGRRRRGWGRRPRLRVSSLLRALRRKAAAVGGRVRASAAKVAARLREGRPYIGDLFAGNYMFLQVTPSSPATDLDGNSGKGIAPFTEYYYGRVMGRRPPPALQLHAAAASGVADKV